jgi:hypothetical protein
MTRNRDIERVLDRFYAEGPSEVPDRVLLGVFDRIERTPQRRLALQMTRFATMNTNLRLAAAAAIVVALVGVGALALSRMSDIAAPATPSPSQFASPSPATGGSTPLPAAFQGRWVGAPRVVPEAPEPPFRNALNLTENQLGFAMIGQGSQQQFASQASLAAPDQILLRGASTDGGCKPRDEGTYSFSLDASGTALTITPIADACGPRAAALAGEWTHVGCPDEGWCLGDLTAGDHLSTLFNPFVLPADWQYAYGRLSYAVPAGWSNVGDCTTCYALAKQGAAENTVITIYSDIVPHVQDAACTEGAEPGVGRTAKAIADWLASLPGLVKTTPTPITVGGLKGFSVDLTVKAGWTHTCSYSEGKSLVSTLTDADPAEGFDWNIPAGASARYILLDLGDGRALVIDIEGQTTADYDALLPDATQVVNSFVFHR